jgi:hypothetical protein
MPSTVITFTGTLAKINPDYLRCIYIYLVRGPEVLAETSVQEDGSFKLALSRNVALAAGGPGLHAVVGPAGMGKHLAHLPNLQPLPIKRADLEKSEAEFRISTEGLKLSEAILNTWWTWCRWYCVSGNIVGPDGCPVPGAQVTVNSVGVRSVGIHGDPGGHGQRGPQRALHGVLLLVQLPLLFPLLAVLASVVGVLAVVVGTRHPVHHRSVRTDSTAVQPLICRLANRECANPAGGRGPDSRAGICVRPEGRS